MSAPDEGQLRTQDGTRIFYRRVAATDQGGQREHRGAGPSAKARVLVVHGFAEHSGRYVHVLRALAEKGFDAWALDLRGYGKSDGGRGCVKRFDEYLDDVATLLAAAAQDRERVPLFVLGHSMGGLVATRFVEDRPSGVKGLCLSSPFFRVKMPVPFTKRLAASVLSSVLPNLALTTNLDASNLSRDPEVVKAYTADPLVFGTATTRWFTEAMKAQQRAIAAAPSLRIPVLIVHGAADGLADPEGSRAFFDRLGAPDKTLKLWPELRHEVLNEPEKLEVVAVFTDWIDKHLATT